MSKLNLKVGQCLAYKNTKIHVLGQVVSVSEDGAFLFNESVIRWYTNSELQENFILPKEKWVPKIGDIYWYASSDGEISKFEWGNDEFDNKVKDFLGIYETESLALEARDKIKKLLSE